MTRAIDREIDRRQLAYLGTNRPEGNPWKPADLALRGAQLRRLVATIAACARELEEVLSDPFAPGAGERFRKATARLNKAAADRDSEGWALLYLAEVGKALAWYERQAEQGKAVLS